MEFVQAQPQVDSGIAMLTNCKDVKRKEYSRQRLLLGRCLPSSKGRNFLRVNMRFVHLFDSSGRSKRKIDKQPDNFFGPCKDSMIFSSNDSPLDEHTSDRCTPAAPTHGQ